MVLAALPVPVEASSSQPTSPPGMTATERLARLLRLQVLYSFFATMHWALAYRFLVVERGFSLEATLLVPALIYLTALLVTLVLPRFECRFALRFGFFTRILVILPYAFWPTPLGIYLGSVVFGITMVIFWVPYNIMFFEHRANSNKAGISALYSSIAPFTDVVATLLAGALVVHYGYQALFVAAILVGIVPLVVSLRLTPREPMKVDLWSRLGRLKRLRTMMFLSGYSQGILWPAVPIATLFFIRGTFAYAGFFAALGLTGALAAIVLGRFSDRRAKRLLFIIPFAFLYGIANMLSALAVNVAQWGVWRGVSTFSSSLFDPFKNAVLLDKADSVVDLYIAREFLLNGGRVLGVVTLAGFAHFGMLQFALIIPGFVAFLFPLIIELKDLYPEERLVLKPFRTLFRQ